MLKKPWTFSPSAVVNLKRRSLSNTRTTFNVRGVSSNPRR
jgi:hypothetical protein